MSGFLDLFPKIDYDINKSGQNDYQSITNILFRVNFIKEALNDASAYFFYDITDSDTPEILAEKIYKNPDAYWMITYANNMRDAQHDWPLNYIAFNKYIEGKYGSINTAKTNYHHYEKVIERSYDGEVLVTRFEINSNPYTLNDINDLNIPYDSYISLPNDQEVITINIDGKTVIQTTYRNAVTIYDYEEELNNSKRSIKIIKQEYYAGIQKEFENILNVDAGISYLRKLL
jgi:hypothetical protein